MKLTTRGRYAVTAMLDLALHFDNEPVTLVDIAERQGISLSYLEQLFAKLRKQGLVESIRGPGGGYRLASSPEDIAVADVIVAVDENMDTTKCGGTANCHNKQRCLTHDLWADLSQLIYQFLRGVSLAQLVARQGVQEVARRQGQTLQKTVTIEELLHSSASGQHAS